MSFFLKGIMSVMFPRNVNRGAGRLSSSWDWEMTGKREGSGLYLLSFVVHYCGFEFIPFLSISTCPVTNFSSLLHPLSLRNVNIVTISTLTSPELKMDVAF
jgi:hypothetical protein